MKTTRRGFLGLMAAVVPAAAALAPSVGQAASENVGITPEWRQNLGNESTVTSNVDMLTVHSSTVTIKSDDLTFGGDARFSFTPASETLAEWDADGNLIYLKDGLTRDAIDQSLADKFGDGVTDATAYIQGLVDRGQRIPPGTFLLTAPIKLSKSSVVIHGHGVGVTVFRSVPELEAWYRADGMVQTFDCRFVSYEILPLADAIAQARADGYNRGREVESARQEARQEQSDEIVAALHGEKPMRLTWSEG